MQSNPNRISSSVYNPRTFDTSKDITHDFRRDYTEPRKRASLRAHRTGRGRKNVFVRGDRDA